MNRSPSTRIETKFLMQTLSSKLAILNRDPKQLIFCFQKMYIYIYIYTYLLARKISFIYFLDDVEKQDQSSRYKQTVPDISEWKHKKFGGEEGRR